MWTELQAQRCKGFVTGQARTIVATGVHSRAMHRKIFVPPQNFLCLKNLFYKYNKQSWAVASYKNSKLF